MSLQTTFHDLLQPLTGERVSLRTEAGRLVERAQSLPGGGGRDVDASGLVLLPALYDADAHLPLVPLGLRESDAYVALSGGVARVNVALQWQEIRDLDLPDLVADITARPLPKITPILSVHSDQDSTGFGEWLAEHRDEVASLLPPVCKLYSYGEGFWENLDTVFDAGLLPIIYCKDFADVEAVVAKARGPVHFRHAMTEELVHTMRQLDGATLQTSPHFLLPVSDEVRSQLYVLPPVADAATRDAFLPLVMDEIDLIVTDHNAPPMTAPTGPGLQVQQHFLPALLTAARQNDWPLADVLAKATTAPAAHFGVELGEPFAIVDPTATEPVGLWAPRQTADRAPYAGLSLDGRVVAVGSDEEVVLL
ncbi:MAG: hypothetical protein S0880_30890 [Actinomycetota bacterium]|nr:hypothetical protein [Actinomycetota bacterium]